MYCYNNHSQHSVQRFITSEGAKRSIWEDIIEIPKYFWQLTVAGREDINKIFDMIIVYQFCSQKF